MPPGSAKGFQASRYIDAVAEDVVAVDDDVADVDADAELRCAGRPARRRGAAIMARWTSTAQRTASIDAGELGQ